ncbi:unnamed protein product [Ectocarpus sp. 8 AP-2014]
MDAHKSHTVRFAENLSMSKVPSPRPSVPSLQVLVGRTTVPTKGDCRCCKGRQLLYYRRQKEQAQACSQRLKARKFFSSNHITHRISSNHTTSKSQNVTCRSITSHHIT